MNQFELFCLIYYALDAIWEKTGSGELGDYLSAANPFLFSGKGSADPAVFAEFCQMVPDCVPLENSFEEAEKYVNSLNSFEVAEAFKSYSKEAFLSAAADYMANPH